MRKYLGCGALFLVLVSGAVKADGLNSSIVAKPYVGLGAGISYSNDLYDNVKDDLSYTGIGVHGGAPLAPTVNIYMGAEIGRNVEVRVGYLYLGKYDVDIKYPPAKGTASATWTAWGADVLLKVPTMNEGVNFFGKLGVASTRGELKLSGDLGHASDTDTKTTFVPGVGVKNDFSESAGFAVELDYYPKLAESGDGDTYSMLTFTGNLYFRF